MRLQSGSLEAGPSPAEISGRGWPTTLPFPVCPMQQPGEDPSHGVV